MLRHENGRSAKIVKIDNNWVCVYFEKDEPYSSLKEKFKTKKEATRSANNFFTSGLI